MEVDAPAADDPDRSRDRRGGRDPKHSAQACGGCSNQEGYRHVPNTFAAIGAHGPAALKAVLAADAVLASGPLSDF
jgi:hypothetical protein